MRSNRIRSLIPAAILGFMVITSAACRSSYPAAGPPPPAPPPPPPPPQIMQQTVPVSSDGSIPETMFIVYVSGKDDTVDWDLGENSPDNLDIQVVSNPIEDSFDPVVCQDKNGRGNTADKKKKCSLKVKKSKSPCEPAIGYKYSIVVTHPDGSKKVNDPVIIWR
ncbi:MAG: hypothetical protein ABI718_00070 [Acidobacteriota bacterium]